MLVQKAATFLVDHGVVAEYGTVLASGVRLGTSAFRCQQFAGEVRTATAVAYRFASTY
jgi:hypothetical protein